MPAAVQEKPQAPNAEPQPPVKGQNKNAEKLDPKAKGAEKKKKGGAGIVIALLIVVLLIGAGVAVVVYNVFGIRDKYLNDLLRNVPIVNNLLPEPEAVSEDPLAGLTTDELISQIRALETQIDRKDTELDDLTAKYNRNLTELSNLQGIEDYQAEVKQQKADFDKMIALNDPKAYAAFYEAIEPQNAAELYKEAVTTLQASKELKNYVAMYSSMEPDSAAQILEAMIASDMTTVVRILKNMSSDASGAILAAMTPANAARVGKMLAPAP